MGNMFKGLFDNRLLLGILLPVLILGTLFSVALNRLLVPPIVSLLEDRTDAILDHVSEHGILICEERFNYILELRMEENREMNSASKQEAIENIRHMSTVFPGIHLFISETSGRIIGKSKGVTLETFDMPLPGGGPGEIVTTKLGDRQVRLIHRYFPFWQWRIITYITEEDYMAPIRMARHIVLLGTFGVLSVVMLITLVLFVWRINRPLKRIIRATGAVGKGEHATIPVSGRDEMSRVSLAFNAMVKSLAEERAAQNTLVERLKTSEEQYRVLTESSLANIAIIQDGAYVFANKMMGRTLGLEPWSVVGKPLWNNIHEGDREWVRESLGLLRKKGADSTHFECRMIPPDPGAPIWFEVLATRIQIKGEDAVLIHGLNITVRKRERQERRKLEEKLSRAQKMEVVGALAGGVAHDLNNILSALVGFPDLLLFDMARDDPRRKPIETIRKSGLKAANIVQDLLTLARRGVAVTQVVDLNRIIREYLQSPEFAKLASFHPTVRVDIDLASGLLPVKGSEVHLSKTVMNLVSNAAEAMPDGGVVSITTRNRYVDAPIGSYDIVTEGDYAVMTVSDTGIGIPQQDLEKIFEPFYTKKVMGRSGTGLGMAVVWGTVKDHKGYIDMDSTKGEGTTFRIYLPVTREAAKAETAAPTPRQLQGSGQTVLVVDDVPEQLYLASGMLRQLGYEVAVASSGEEAVAYMEGASADLLVLDMIMSPGIDGLETYERILARHPGQRAILASGYSETGRVKKALALGAGQYIKKPYTIETLGLAVQQELDPGS